jgi:polar amino acid transport system substrate-binding protein
MKNEQVLVVKSDSGISSQADLKGKKLALQTGSSAEEALDSNAEFKASLGEVNTMSDNMTCFMDLTQGGVDAVLVDSIVAGWYITTGNL